MATLIRRFADLGEAYEGEPGFEKIRRQRRNFEDEGRDGRGRRENGPQRREDPPQANGDQKKPAVVTPPAIEKEENKLTNTTQNPTTAPATTTPLATGRVAPLYCPLCGQIRKRPTDLVCGDCYRRYTNEAAIQLARGGFVNLFQWVAGKVTTVLASLEAEHGVAVAAFKKLQTEVHESAYQEVKANAGGNFVDRAIFNNAIRVKKEVLWQNRGGNVAFAKMKGLEGRITLIREIIDKSKEPTTATTATPPAADPAQPETPAAVPPPTPPATVTAAAPTAPPATPIAQTAPTATPAAEATPAPVKKTRVRKAKATAEA